MPTIPTAPRPPTPPTDGDPGTFYARGVESLEFLGELIKYLGDSNDYQFTEATHAVIAKGISLIANFSAYAGRLIAINEAGDGFEPMDAPDPIATQDQAISGTSEGTIMSPLRMANVVSVLRAHRPGQAPSDGISIIVS